TYFLEIAVFPGLLSIAILGALLGWLERKLTARVQLRVGPLYASPAGGILQMFADIIKLLFKELTIPDGADRFFFIMSPVTALIIPQLLVASLFIVTSTAEMERLPFDLPEAESEIMMGWQAEYPGPLFMLVQGPAFVKLYAFSALFTTIYLGGYLGPSPIPPIVWFFLKMILIIALIMLFRSTFPRVRLDQLLRQGWTTLLTLSIANIIIAYFLVVGIPAI